MMAEAAATFLLAAASPDKIEEPVMGTAPANDLTVKGKKKEKGDKKSKGKGELRPSSREASDSDSASNPNTRPGTSGTSGSRPGTSSSRPGTSSSTRPSTAERPESSSEQNSERKLPSKPEETPTDGESKIRSRPGTSNKSDQKKTSIETRKILANAAALAATILEDESISLLIVDETVALDYRQDRTFLFQANCWGEQNQGLFLSFFLVYPVLLNASSLSSSNYYILSHSIH
jgi:DNA mismatch repair ATPase MutL